MVIVPLPSAANDHQTANARVLEGAGAARLLPERELSVEALDAVVGGLLSDRSALVAMATAARARGRPRAAAEIAGHIARLIRG